jgi:hypothetical protein
MVEHDRVEVSMYDPVCGGVIAGSNEDGVSLCDSNTNQIDRVLFHVRLLKIR